MPRARLIKTSDGIGQALNAFIQRGKTVQAYLNRKAYRQYQTAQKERWQSENTSETGQWAPLSTKPFFAYWEKGPDGKFGTYYAGGYEEQKKYLYAEFPGGGNALMIATGKLSQAAMGRGDGKLKVITNTTMTVGIDDSAIPYGKWAAEARPFMHFGPTTIQKITGDLARWLIEGGDLD